MKITSITIQPKDQSYTDQRQGAFLRVPVAQANLVEGHGIQGDAKAGSNPSRQLNLLSAAWLADLSEKGYQTEPGKFGEQIILEGIRVEELQPGDRLVLGSAAIIEITKVRDGCRRLELAQNAPGQFAGKPIGMLAKVVQGGEIRVGDEVRVLV